VHFRVEGEVVVRAKTPDLLDLAGSVPVPPQDKGRSWEEIRDAAWARQWQDRES